MSRTLAAGVIFLLAGCASVGDPRITDDALVAKVEKGKSRKADVEALFGPPGQVDFTDAGFEKWLYTYSYSQVRGSSFIPFAGSFVGGTDIQTSTLTVQFTKEGVVENVGRGGMTGGGGGLQDTGRMPASNQPSTPDDKPKTYKSAQPGR